MNLHAHVIAVLAFALWAPVKGNQAEPSRQPPADTKPTSSKDCCVLELFNPASPSTTNKARNGSPIRHVEGNDTSSIRVIIYEDLQCPDCAAFRKALDETLLPRYGGAVAFEHRDFPLPKHAWAKEAAIAARYFQSLDPRLAVEFRRHIQQRISEVSTRGFRAELIEFSRRNGLDSDKALASLTDETSTRAVEDDFQGGVAAGIRRTPTVIVGSKSFVETIDLTELQSVLDARLRELPQTPTNGKDKR